MTNASVEAQRGRMQSDAEVYSQTLREAFADAGAQSAKAIAGSVETAAQAVQASSAASLEALGRAVSDFAATQQAALAATGATFADVSALARRVEEVSKRLSSALDGIASDIARGVGAIEATRQRMEQHERDAELSAAAAAASAAAAARSRDKEPMRRRARGRRAFSDGAGNGSAHARSGGVDAAVPAGRGHGPHCCRGLHAALVRPPDADDALAVRGSGSSSRRRRASSICRLPRSRPCSRRPGSCVARVLIRPIRSFAKSSRGCWRWGTPILPQEVLATLAQASEPERRKLEDLIRSDDWRQGGEETATQRIAGRLEAAAASQEAVTEALRRELGPLVAGYGGTIQADGSLVFPDTVLFEAGKAEITPELRAFLGSVCLPWIRTVERSGASVSDLRIEGHASSEWTREASRSKPI